MKWVILGPVLLCSSSLTDTGYLIAYNQSPVASLNFLMEGLWIGIGIIIGVTIVAVVLHIKLKKSTVFSRRDARTCHDSPLGKTSHSGLHHLLLIASVKQLRVATMVTIPATAFCFSIVGKSYDALLVSYKSEEEAGMMELDRKWMKSILEERFGYAVYDFNIMRGKGRHVRWSERH